MDVDHPVVLDVEPHRRAIAAHAAVTRCLATMTTVEDVLRAVAQQLCDLVGASRCSVYLKDEDTGIYRGAIGRASTDIDGRVRQLIAGVEADRFTREIVETGRPVLVTDARVDPRPVRSTMRAWDVRSMLGVPLTRDGDVIGLAFVDDERGTHRFTPADYEAAAAFGQLAGGAVGQALATIGARRDLRAVTAQNRLLRRAAALDERLTRLAVDGGGLDAILSVVAERTGKPVAVLGRAERPLAVAPAGEAGAFLREQLERWPLGPDDVDRLGDEPAAAGPFPDRGIHHRFMLGAIRARGETLGALVMGEVGGALSALDRHAVRRAGAMVALELSAQRRVVEAERDCREALLSDLLRGDRDADWLTRRGLELGLDLEAPHVVCLVAGDTPHATPGGVALAERLGARLPGTSVAATDLAEAAALLAPVAGSMRGAVETLRDELSATIAGEGLVAAISEPVFGAGDIPHAHEQASQVLRSLRNLAAGAAGATPVLCAHELGAGRLFLSSVDRREADQFARRALGCLLADGDGDGAHPGPELLDTLQEFFVCGRGLRLTATALGVHENTIRYRFARIKELSGLDVHGDADDQTTALLALRILQLGGERPWGSTVDASAASAEVAAMPAVQTS